ncbi:MAG: sigma-70 family RNA polymerase sigma factor [Thermoanaerobaculia bacterium]|nr:sigma-70 family RNA polymerase sigma factor [Thermoanaerobaculia bacterium]
MEEERSLLDRVSRGDDEAFAELFYRYQPRVARFAARMTRRPDLVDEIVNDTMVVVWRRAAAFRGDSRVSTWILGIAYRTALKRLRRAARHLSEALPEDLPQPADDDPEAHARRVQSRALVRRALARLSPPHRAVVELAFFEELSYTEIARIVGCPPNTVKTRMYHARRNLRRILRILDAKPAVQRSRADDPSS